MIKRLQRNLPVFLVILVLAGLLTYGFWPKAVEVEIAHPVRGSLLVTVRDDGETRIREKYVVSAPVDGKLVRIGLHAGDRVRQGDTVVARIQPGDPSLLDARTRAQAESRVRAAEAARQQAMALLQVRNESLAEAQHDFDRARELIASKAVAKAEFDRAEHEFGMSQSSVRSAEFASKIADFELDLAKAALIRTQTDGTADDAVSLSINAPIDGQILRVLREDSGAISSGTPLVELGNPRDLEMRIDLLSTDAAQVRPGAKVFVEHWGGSAVLEGVVRVVEPSAFLKVSALGVEEKRVNVIADFTTPYEKRESLGDGYRIEARIVLEEIEDSLKVPSGVLFRDGDAWCALAIEKGRACLRHVEVGQSTDIETQVLSGIKMEDILILHPTDKVRDGVRVVHPR